MMSCRECFGGNVFFCAWQNLSRFKNAVNFMLNIYIGYVTLEEVLCSKVVIYVMKIKV